MSERLVEKSISLACQIRITGAVQGVGFRPLVYQVARGLGLTGSVKNDPAGLTIHVEGSARGIENFIERLQARPPVSSSIQTVHREFVSPRGERDFLILPSDAVAEGLTLVPADLSTCEACHAEIFDPQNRRFRYPFTHCTHCGPRYSMMIRLPYDRERTSMRHFQMCPECQREYDDPADRRFHSEANACPRCGPRLQFWDHDGRVLAESDAALNLAVEAIRQGQILAAKGVGGFHLIVDAGNETAVRELRQRKAREEKPFALLFPSLDKVREFCEVSDAEAGALVSVQRPIVLLTKRQDDAAWRVASSVAPANAGLGVMLPGSPLQELLMADLGFPVVATSGNISDVPMCIDERSVRSELGRIADVFLTHNRPILRPVDDSVVRVMRGKISVQRRARGYAPLPVDTIDSPLAVMGVGAEDKVTVALRRGGKVFLSQHLGHLRDAATLEAFKSAVEDLKTFFGPADFGYACDRHPDYFSSRYARDSGRKVSEVQHHHAHVAAGMAEYHLSGEVFGLAWDGAGFGDDGTVWGGEGLVCTLQDYRRVARLRPFCLPGGDAASRHPARVALALLLELGGDFWEDYRDLSCFEDFSATEVNVMRRMMSRGVNSPRTSSMGRLFDGVSALAGLCQRSSFEAQAAMALEAALSGINGQDAYDAGEDAFLTDADGLWQWDWSGMIRQVVMDVRIGADPARISLKFHNTLIALGVCWARKAGLPRVVLSGGCFQNKFLLEGLAAHLEKAGFEVFSHLAVPCNDGGIALGQVVVASSRMGSSADSGKIVNQDKPS